MRLVKYSLILSVSIMLSACNSGSSSGGDSDDADAGPGNGGDTTNTVTPPVAYATPFGVEECSVEDMNRRVEFDMRDYYIYYDQVAELNQAEYESPSDYIRALRVDPDIYSNVRDSQTQSSLFEEGETAAFGIWIGRAGDGVGRVRNVMPGSPTDLAGVLRGDEVIELEGIPYDDVTEDDFRAAFAADNVADLLIRTEDEAPRLVSLTRETFYWRTGGPAKKFSSTSDPSLPVIGYLPVRSFLETTRTEIDNSFNFFRSDRGIGELILDLRYNSGGRVDVANYLASLIAGDAVANEVSNLFRYNDKYSANNSFDYFYSIDDALNLPRLIVLTTPNSASSSEIVINSLKPYIEVITVGTKTEGKAFISSGRNYCGKTINAMKAIGENASGVSVVGGIEPNCAVEDDWQYQARDQRDAMLGVAIDYARDRGCDVLVAGNDSLLRSLEIEQVMFGDAPKNFVNGAER